MIVVRFSCTGRAIFYPAWWDMSYDPFPPVAVWIVPGTMPDPPAPRYTLHVPNWTADPHEPY